MVATALLAHSAAAIRGAAHAHPPRHHVGAGGVRCSTSPPPPQPPLPPSKLVSRRAAAVAATGLLAFHLYPATNRADAGGLFDKYMKRKKLDPLETYVPAVLLSQAQFKDLEKVLDLEKPEYDFSRSLLRSGPAASLRINIRAVLIDLTNDNPITTLSTVSKLCHVEGPDTLASLITGHFPSFNERVSVSESRADAGPLKKKYLSLYKLDYLRISWTYHRSTSSTLFLISWMRMSQSLSQELM